MKDLAWLTQKPVAHRGLHDNKTIPENSLAAYKNAVDHGYPIELDVYLTKDGELIMHHDPVLKRTVGIHKFVTNIDSSNLNQYKLYNTDECIPTFDQMLKLVNGKVGLIIEIKKTNRPKEVCEAVMNKLKNYDGKYCVESFDIKVVDYMHKHYPDVILGQLYDYFFPQRLIALSKKQHEKVDFMAVCIRNGRYQKFLDIRKTHKDLLFITWTVRTPDQLELAKELYDNYIFETNLKNPAYIELPILT